MKKVILLAFLLSLAGLLGRQVYHKVHLSRSGPLRQHRAMSVAVEVTPVKRTTIRDIGRFTGTLKPRSQFIVAPKIAGRLERLLVNIADDVRRGQLIAVLENDEYLQQVDQAKAELEVSRASLEESRSNLNIARRDFERAKTLRQKEIVSEAKLDAAEAEFNAQNAKHKVAIAHVTEKEAALKAARVRLAYTQIRVHWEDGDETRVVGERFVDEGAMLAPNAPIVSILDLASLTAVIHVIERDYSKVREGQQAVLTTDAFPGRTFTGKVVRVAPLLKETSRQARVEIKVSNPRRLLKPGMFIRVEIEFATLDNVIAVPRSVLVKRNGLEGVFLVERQTSRAHFVPVTLGIVEDELVEVRSPQLSGDVVTLGQHLLEENSQVTLPRQSPPSPAQGAAGAGSSPKKQS